MDERLIILLLGGEENMEGERKIPLQGGEHWKIEDEKHTLLEVGRV